MSSLLTHHQIKNFVSKNENRHFFDFCNTFDNSDILFKAQYRFTDYYISACRNGNMEVVDFLYQNRDKYKVDIDFTTIETTSYGEEDRPNGALTYVISEGHNNILEYFIVNDIYNICSETEDYFNILFSGWKKDIEHIESKIELKMKLEKELQSSEEIYSPKL